MGKPQQNKQTSKPEQNTPWQVMNSDFNPVESMTKRKFRPGIDDRNFFTRDLGAKEEKIFRFLLKLGLIVLGVSIAVLLILIFR